MKNMKKIIIGMLITMLLAIGASISVSAKAIGADYTIMGYNAGWVLIILGIGVGLLFASKLVTMPKSIGMKPLVGFVAIMMVAGLMMVFVDTPTPASATTLGSIEFDIEASALTTDGSYYPDTTFDESSNMFTIPYVLDISAGTINESADNSAYTGGATQDPHMKFIIKADFPADATDDDLAKIYYEVVNPTLYIKSDPDNYVLVKTDDVHQATWHDQDASYTNVSGWTSGGVEETFTVWLRLELYEAGLAKADVYKNAVLSIRFFNQDNTWSESFSVNFICTKAWA